jgi:hypothetical protein
MPRGKSHTISLLANIGTTFTSIGDDILGLQHVFRRIGSDIVYICADEALDLGFPAEEIFLGPLDVLERIEIPVVQGITMSYHEAFEIIVSGGVICYKP